MSFRLCDASVWTSQSLYHLFFFPEPLHHMLSLFKSRRNLCSEQGLGFPALSLSLSLYLPPLPGGERSRHAVLLCQVLLGGAGWRLHHSDARVHSRADEGQLLTLTTVTEQGVIGSDMVLSGTGGQTLCWGVIPAARREELHTLTCAHTQTRACLYAFARVRTMTLNSGLVHIQILQQLKIH